MNGKKFSISARIKSFVPALQGLKMWLLEEHNSRIQLAAALLVMVAGFVFEISEMEWIILVLTIALVFSMEIINTSIECLADIVSSERNASIKKIKDLSAASVLLSAVAAAIVGLIIFLPRILW